MQQLSKFENLFIESPLLGHVSSYLTLCDINNLIKSSKNIYFSPETIFIIRKNVKTRSCLVISKLIKRYSKIIVNINNIIQNAHFFPSERYYYYTPFYFYRYYPRDYINAYFKCVQKKLYKNNTYELDNDKTKSDLFNLIHQLSNEEISYIGW